MDFDCSYDGDSDIRNSNGSKLKSRRRNKKHRKDHKRRSPSPAKGKNNKKTFEDDYELECDNEQSSESQARRVAESIRGSQASAQRPGYQQQAKIRYQPLEQTSRSMSAATREKLQGNIAAILGGTAKRH